jgi:EAL domain-containing protein (putative c-di-GMP-specific phosphodiesterase class I)
MAVFSNIDARRGTVVAVHPLGFDEFDGSVRADQDLDERRERFRETLLNTTPSIALDPVIHIESGSRVGFEALARFPGTGPTDGWFEAARAVGIGNDLELKTIVQVVERRTARKPGFLGVNVSAQALLDPRCITELRPAAGLELVVELTDQTALPKMSLLRTKLDELRELEIRIAVHVSEFSADANRLVRFAEPDIVKLNPPLTAALERPTSRSTERDAFLTHCRHTGIFVVAVGVERVGSLPMLELLGVDAAQGYLFSNRT